MMAEAEWGPEAQKLTCAEYTPDATNRYSHNVSGEGCANLDKDEDGYCKKYGIHIGYVLSVKCPARGYPADKGWKKEEVS